MEQLGYQWTDFHEISFLSTFFRKTIQKIQVSLNSDKNNGNFMWRPICIYDNISLSSSYNEKCFRRELYRQPKTHILWSITFYIKNRAVYEITRKIYGRSRQAIADNIAHAHCLLHTQGYKHTLRICNTYCFSTATVVARTHLNVNLCAHCLFCFAATACSFWGSILPPDCFVSRGSISPMSIS